MCSCSNVGTALQEYLDTFDSEFMCSCSNVGTALQEYLDTFDSEFMCSCSDVGTALLEYLDTFPSELLYQGKEPSSLTDRGQETINYTLCSTGLVSEVYGWRVSLESLLLDQRHIHFSHVEKQEQMVNYRDLQTTRLLNFLNLTTGRRFWGSYHRMTFHSHCSWQDCM
ncbi:hypothetical protein B7P43_G18388 [Cryptotermes secundus]|uniref:Uncharacterized protein n=1 Tax=Cryptotermes secundus TaxID=105785 RepID=A0A2J7QNX2_9NEOP|nr:hypothetical protein B7P43_G18388 [Cryptotermes secundus]